MASTPSLLVIGVALLLAAASTEETYVPYSYTGANGPQNWGTLSPSYAACVNSKAQSPINIVKDDVVFDSNLDHVDRNYTVANATLINNGFNLGLSFGNGAGVAKIDGKTYTLKQMHWHTPSEHTIDGERFAAELHLVHMADDGSVAIIANLFETGSSQPLLKKIKDELNELKNNTCGADQETQISIEDLKTKHLNRKAKKYYRYVGSLTAPPCSENITWIVLDKVRKISKEQVEALQAPLNSANKDNARPVQPLNGRKVQLYNELEGKKKLS